MSGLFKFNNEINTKDKNILENKEILIPAGKVLIINSDKKYIIGSFSGEIINDYLKIENYDILSEVPDKNLINAEKTKNVQIFSYPYLFLNQNLKENSIVIAKNIIINQSLKLNNIKLIYNLDIDKIIKYEKKNQYLLFCFARNELKININDLFTRINNFKSPNENNIISNSNLKSLVYHSSRINLITKKILLINFGIYEKIEFVNNIHKYDIEIISAEYFIMNYLKYSTKLKFSVIIFSDGIKKLEYYKDKIAESFDILLKKKNKIFGFGFGMDLISSLLGFTIEENKNFKPEFKFLKINEYNRIVENTSLFNEKYTIKINEEMFSKKDKNKILVESIDRNIFSYQYFHNSKSKLFCIKNLDFLIDNDSFFKSFF